MQFGQVNKHSFEQWQKQGQGPRMGQEPVATPFDRLTDTVFMTIERNKRKVRI